MRKEALAVPVYHCTNCHFTFKSEGKVETCPDCGKPDIRPATKEEIEDFKHFSDEDWNK